MDFNVRDYVKFIVGGPHSYRNCLLLSFCVVSGKGYPNSSEKDMTLSLHFPNTYVCEHGFS